MKVVQAHKIGQLFIYDDKECGHDADRRFTPNIAEYVDMAGAGHMVAGNQNDTFSKGILEFLVRL